MKELTFDSTVPIEPTLPLTYDVTSDRTCLSDDRVVPMSELSDAISELAEARSLANDWNSWSLAAASLVKAPALSSRLVIEGPSFDSACSALPEREDRGVEARPVVADGLGHVVHELAERAVLVGARRPERLDQLVEQRDRLVHRLRQRGPAHRDHRVVRHDRARAGTPGRAGCSGR